MPSLLPVVARIKYFPLITISVFNSAYVVEGGVGYSWAENASGQLGDNTTTADLTPVAICGGLTFTELAAGTAHAIGLTSTGIAYGWGINTNGAIGDNTVTNYSTPRAVCGGLTFSEVAAGNNFSFGITTTT